MIGYFFTTNSDHDEIFDGQLFFSNESQLGASTSTGIRRTANRSLTFSGSFDNNSSMQRMSMDIDFTSGSQERLNDGVTTSKTNEKKKQP